MMLPPRAYIFIGLNIVRVMSIIALLLVFSSNVVTLSDDIKAYNSFMSTRNEDHSSTSNSTMTAMADSAYIAGSTVPDQVGGIFWAVLNRLFICLQVVFLIMSELRWPGTFFDRFFPILGNDFGLGALGVIQCLIGAAILSHFVSTFTLVAAFFLFGIGCLNIFLGLIFREKAKLKRSLTSWRDHAKSALPTHVGGIPTGPAVSVGTKLFNRATEKFATTPDASANPNVHMESQGWGSVAQNAAAARGYPLINPRPTKSKYSPS